MHYLWLVLIFTFTLHAGEPMQKHFYDFEAKNIKGKTISMSQYKGKVLLIVNVASECGFTPQYEGLEKLYETYKEQGFEILAFPCNQFGDQEPGSSEEIQKFCSTKFSVTFPLFQKIEVNGDNTHPLYVFLKSEATGFLGSESIKWNFTKFLIDKKGNVIERYGSITKPATIAKDIEKLLKG
jgi:glutathione peroxidase